MKKLPSISIIIPTLNRKKVLKEALLSLNGVDYPTSLLEVVVISDGSTDGTPTMIKQIKGSLKYKFVFIKEERRGISHTKNVGIKKSKGEIIVSTDDDCLFEKDWLKKLIKPFKNQKVGVVGGSDRSLERAGIMAKSVDYAFSSFVGSGGVHGRFLKLRLGKFYPVGCNSAFRREVFEKVGLFDENLAPGEDTDLNHRAENMGFKLVYSPKAFVWHRPRSSIKTFIPHIFKRGAARLEIIRRHHQYAELIYFLPAAMVIVGGVLLILSFFSLQVFKIFLVLVFLYFLFLLSAGMFAVRAYRNWLFIISVPILIFVQHTVHGIGFLTNMIKLNYKEKK